MIDLIRVPLDAHDTGSNAPVLSERPDEADVVIANMDETDWMALMMEMRIISA